MSFSASGVKFNQKPKKNIIFSAFFRFAEFVLSILFVITLAGPLAFPNQAEAVLGVSKYLSYQGRLTDSSGNPLGGSGTTYCFSFSIFDASSGGSKLWPTSATTTSELSVANGLFNTSVGPVDAFDFSSNDTVYLNVDVAAQSGGTCTGVSWEGLSPRQKLDAVAYARVATDVYGNQLKTDNTNGIVQIGDSAGAAGTPTLLNLHSKTSTGSTFSYVGQTCSVNGSLWYNSATTKALVCENNQIRALANATTTIDALTVTAANGNATLSSGTVNFAAGNNITLSSGAQAITIHGPAGGAGIAGIAVNAATTYTSGTIVFSGGNNITLGTNGQTVTISAFNQTVQTQNVHNLTISSNTAGVGAAISSGTLTLAGGANITLSQNGGNAITIIGAAGGAGINGISAGTTSQAPSSIYFSNANGVSFGLGAGASSSIITASANAGGGGGATVSHWPPLPMGLASSSNYTGATAAGTNITASFHIAPLQLEQALSFSRINLVGSFATVAATGSVSLAHMLGIYTLNGGTALSLSTSYMFRQEISQNSVTAQTHRWYWGTNSTSNSSGITGNSSANVTGYRVLPLFVSAGGNTLSAGQYYIAYAQTNRSSSANIMPAASIMYISQSQSTLGGQLGSASTFTPFPLLGQFSSTTAVGNFTTPFMPASINTTVITNTGGSSQHKWPYVNFLGK